jgi:hypothetical protein
MKAYLLTTATAFGLLTVVHIWRMTVETSVTREPSFWLITLVAAGLCGWAIRLLRAKPQPR